jgi:uncharacterized protein YbaP (TraB family)
MLWRKKKEKVLKMIWEVKKNERVSFLVGTAHFFPYSFKNSLTQLIKDAATVIFEGPLDEVSLAEIRKSGLLTEPGDHVLDELDAQTRERIVDKLLPTCHRKSLVDSIYLNEPGNPDPLYRMTGTMKPWLTFFSIWSGFLEKNGWRYSVDMQAYQIAREMGCHIVFLESKAEQIIVLESLSFERIIGFLKQVDQWESFAKQYVKNYLAGDLEKIRASATGFPSRHVSVIDRRDALFYKRMLPYLEQGNAVACVGAPHVPGICKFLESDGYRTIGPGMTAHSA